MKKNSRDHCKDITLRSGNEVKSSRQREERKEEEKAKKRVENEPDRPAEAVPTHCSEGPTSRGISFLDNPPIISPPLPYPQRFQKKKIDTQFSKFF